MLLPHEKCEALMQNLRDSWSYYKELTGQLKQGDKNPAGQGQRLEVLKARLTAEFVMLKLAEDPTAPSIALEKMATEFKKDAPLMFMDAMQLRKKLDDEPLTEQGAQEFIGLLDKLAHFHEVVQHRDETVSIDMGAVQNRLGKQLATFAQQQEHGPLWADLALKISKTGTYLEDNYQQAASALAAQAPAISVTGKGKEHRGGLNQENHIYSGI